MPSRTPSKHIAWCNDCKQFVGVRQDWIDNGMWRLSVHPLGIRCIGSRSEVHPNNVLLRLLRHPSYLEP